MPRRSTEARRAQTVLSGAVMVAAVASAVAIGGCGKDPIEVLDPDTTEGGDFGRAQLLAAVAEFRKTPDSVEAFARLRTELVGLESTFDEANEELAERMLMFLALGPMEANAARPPDEQIDKLAASVWPVVLGPEPEKGEGGRAYLDRICNDELAGECRYIVPEMRALFLGAKVWRRFRQRAQELFAACRSCQADDSYRAALRRYDELSFPLESEAAERKGEGHPRAWPRAGKAALPWTPVKTIEVSNAGVLRISGEEVSAKKWRATLDRRQRDGDAIGLYLRPGASVALARDFVKDLATIGYREIRLQVRGSEYPYLLGYYPLSTTRRGGVDVGLRATDTVQVAVLAIEQAVERGAAAVSIF